MPGKKNSLYSFYLFACFSEHKYGTIDASLAASMDTVQ